MLVKFRDLLKGKGKDGPPVSIRASDLDSNFEQLQVIPPENGLYNPVMTSKGTRLDFKAGSLGVRWVEISVCADGVMKKMLVLGTDPY